MRLATAVLLLAASYALAEDFKLTSQLGNITGTESSIDGKPVYQFLGEFTLCIDRL